MSYKTTFIKKLQNLSTITPQVLQPDSYKLRTQHLKRFLHSSNHRNPKDFFHLKEFSIQTSKSKPNTKPSNNDHNATIPKNPLETKKFKEILQISSLQDQGKSIDKEPNNILLRKSSKSNWENAETSNFTIVKIAKSFLLANNNDSGALRNKNAVVLGNKQRNCFNFMKYNQPELLQKALIIEKGKGYPQIQRNFSEKNISNTGTQKKGKLFINTFNSFLVKKEKSSIKDLKNDLLIKSKFLVKL